MKSFLSLITLAFLAAPTPSLAATLHSGPGLAAQYPGDANIEKDPRVVQVENKCWICIEQMIAMNDVHDSNGEQALWIDGQLVAHLGKGFPKGRWTFDKFEPGKSGDGVRWSDAKRDREYFKVPDGGAPFEGFRWRTSPELNVNYIWLYVYTQKPPGHRIQVRFDDVIVATEYIGPIVAPK